MILSTKYFSYILIVSVSVIPDDLYATKKVRLVNIFAGLVSCNAHLPRCGSHNCISQETPYVVCVLII